MSGAVKGREQALDKESGKWIKLDRETTSQADRIAEEILGHIRNGNMNEALKLLNLLKREIYLAKNAVQPEKDTGKPKCPFLGDPCDPEGCDGSPEAFKRFCFYPDMPAIERLAFSKDAISMIGRKAWNAWLRTVRESDGIGGDTE